MLERTARGFATTLFAVAVALSALAGVFLVLAWSVPVLPAEFGVKGYGIAFALVCGGVGAVIAARRPSNGIGWIFCGIAVAAALLAVGAEYARWALIVEGGGPPGGLVAAWLQEWLWIPMIGGLAVVAAIFPNGRFLSPPWRRAVWATGVLALVATALAAIVPRLTVYVGYDNPFGVGGRSMMKVVAQSLILVVPLIVLGAAAAVVRFRRSKGEERQQVKWLTLAAAVLALLLVVFAAAGNSENARGGNWSEYIAIAGFLAFPVSIAFGVLKYRLYDIDVVINKTVVYGAMAVFITLVYVAIVVGIGAAVGATGRTVLSAAAAAVVALAFQPVRRSAQRLANRLV